MNDYILLIYPVLIFAILFAGCKIFGLGKYNENAWKIDQAKSMQAFAALMIILHHCVQTITKYGDNYKGPITEWNSFGILFTSIFFFFSGYGLYKSYKTKENYLDGFIGKRLPKLVIPFLVTNIIYLFSSSYGRVMTVRHIFTSILGITLMNTNAWFLVELVVLYFIFYFCFKKAKTEDKAFLYTVIGTSLLVIISLLLCHDQTKVNGHWFMGEWWYNTTMIFVMGLFVARNEDKIVTFCKEKYKVLLPITAILLVAWYFLEEFVLDNLGYYCEWRFHPGYPEKFITLIVQIILCVLFIAFVLLINLKIEFKNRVITFLGGISFEIYLIHDVFRHSVYSKDNMPDVEYFGLVYILSILCAALLSLVDKFLIGLYEDNVKDLLSFKMEKISDDLPYELKKSLKLKRKVIIGVKLFYVLIFVGMIASELVFAVTYVVGNHRRFNEEVEALKNAKVSDRVYYGEWMLNYQKGKAEPIPWIVCDVEDDHILLVSEMVLANESYHDHHEDVAWKESKLCRSLNHDFYLYAFSEKERELLCGRADASDDWYCSEMEAFDYYINEEGEYDEEDIVVNSELVFVLNKEEVLEYMPNLEDRIAKSSEAAKDQGIGTINTSYRAPWWIEDAGEKDCSAMYVKINGTIVESGKVVNNSGMGVRPAIWIKR